MIYMHTTVLVMKHDAMELRAIYSLVGEGFLHLHFTFIVLGHCFLIVLVPVPPCEYGTRIVYIAFFDIHV